MPIELIEADLKLAHEMFAVLDKAAGVEGCRWVQITCKCDGDADTLVIGYGESGEPAILDVIPAVVKRG